MAGGWTFLSNHAHVLICLARDPRTRVRDIAAEVGITERAVHKIVAQLEEEAVLARIREGRRNQYRVDTNAALRRPVASHCTVGDVLALVLGESPRAD